jgi:hypothetical protein
MKTNHQRGFKEKVKPSTMRVSDRRYLNFNGGHKLPLSDRIVGATSFNSDHTNGKHGIAKDRRGAKKFINSRTRFHENQALRLLGLSSI